VSENRVRDEARPPWLHHAAASVRTTWVLLGLPPAEIVADTEADVVRIESPTANGWSRWSVATGGLVRRVVSGDGRTQVWTAEHRLPDGTPVIARYVRRIRSADTTTEAGVVR
jgi:hypothetical protein